MTAGASDDPHGHRTRQRPAWTLWPGRRAPRARCPRSSLVLGGLVLAAVVSTHWVRLNVSPSVPYGLYRLGAVSGPLSRGTLVVLPVPARVQPWHARFVPLLKPVAAIAGDPVCIADDGLWVAGQWYGPVWQQARGMPLPVLRGCLRVPEGKVFLASAAPRSLDSRYFNAVPVAKLTAQTFPLVTWR